MHPVNVKSGKVGPKVKWSFRVSFLNSTSSSNNLKGVGVFM